MNEARAAKNSRARWVKTPPFPPFVRYHQKSFLCPNIFENPHEMKLERKHGNLWPRGRIRWWVRGVYNRRIKELQGVCGPFYLPR